MSADYNGYKEAGGSCLLVIVLTFVVGVGIMLSQGKLTLSFIILMAIYGGLGIPFVVFMFRKYREEKNLHNFFRDKLKGVDYSFLSSVQTESRRSNDMYIFFDTETTGLPRDYDAPASDTRNWPRLVQLSWILEDATRTRISEGNYIIRPDGFTIPYDVTRIHGITQERAEREGIPLRTAIEKFMKDFNMATMAVGHNIDFDKKVVGAELIRLGMVDTMNSKKSYCTMLHGTDICKLPGPYGYKWPKLQELHRALFGCKFNDAHNSASDVAATEKCFWKMKKE